MKTLYSNSCPAWHDTRKISKDKWLQNIRGEGVAGTAKRVVYETTMVQFHDTRNIILQKINQTYCSGGSVAPEPPSPDLLTDLLAYWKMEEDGLVLKEDSHTGNLDLTPNASTAPQQAGIINFGIRLFGSPGKTLKNHDAVFDVEGAMTIAGWVNFNSVAANTFLVGKVDKEAPDTGLPTEGYMLYLNASSQLAYWHGNGVTTSEVFHGMVPSDGVWYFIVCGFEGGTQFIQVNNGSRTSLVGIANTPGLLQFVFGGARTLSISGPDAVFDEFGVWARALTLAEADYLYNSGAGNPFL